MTHYHFSAISKHIEPLWSDFDMYQVDFDVELIPFNPGDLTWCGWYLGDFSEMPDTEMVGGSHPAIKSPWAYTTLTGNDPHYLAEAAQINLVQMVGVIGTDGLSTDLVQLLIKEAIRASHRDWLCMVACAAEQVLECSRTRTRWGGAIPTLPTP